MDACSLILDVDTAFKVYNICRSVISNVIYNECNVTLNMTFNMPFNMTLNMTFNMAFNMTFSGCGMFIIHLVSYKIDRFYFIVTMIIITYLILFGSPNYK